MLQLTLDDALSRADAGIARVTLATERRVPGWVDMAIERLRSWAQARPEPFTIEIARAAIEPGLPEPSDGRVWGAVTRAAVRAGVIEPTGGFAPAASSNGSPKRLYRGGGL